jgi:potassium-transporting ATPase potassium-binding subunit
MIFTGWLELLIFVVLLFVITKPLGMYLCRVLDANGKTFLDPLIKPLERLTYRILGVEPQKEQGWVTYTLSLLGFSVISSLMTYGILRWQGGLPLNPQGLPPVSEPLAFNTALSFVTNTNWQNYAGENTMSYLSQMLALASHNFFSAAVGIAVAAVLVRGIARQRTRTVGNFWVDLVRVIYYLLLPLSIVYAWSHRESRKTLNRTTQ